MEMKSLTHLLEQIAFLLELRNDNPFKIKAYRQASSAMQEQNETLELLISDDHLESIPGIGKAISEKIRIFVKEERLPYYEELIKEVPETLLDLLKLEGLGIARVRRLWKSGIESVEDLRDFFENSPEDDLAGFSPALKMSLQAVLATKT